VRFIAQSGMANVRNYGKFPKNRCTKDSLIYAFDTNVWQYNAFLKHGGRYLAVLYR
jgi:hypothetical protein